MRLCRLLSLFCLALVFASAVSARAASPYDKVVVESAATSIYIGKVTLLLSPLTRKDGVYSGDYRAKVFPYFFMNEHGTFRMNVSDEDLARVIKGEAIDFTGEAENSDQEARKITGRATPDETTHGKIKVRIFVTKKIQLIFNTRYRFAE